MSGAVPVRIVDLGAGVAEIVLDRPARLNALSMGMLEALGKASVAIAEIRPGVVVVSSACERAFSVGADLKERGLMSAAETLAARPAMLRGYRSLLGLACPVIAAVHGYCLGGGFELALSCDLIVCSDSAVLGLPEVTVGIIPGGGGTQLVARRAGWGVAADLLFTGRRVTGTEAASLGLVDRLVAREPREDAVVLARTVAAASPAATASAKRALTAGWGQSLPNALAAEDAEFASVLAGPDREEGLRAFAEGRPARWPSALR